MDRKEIEKKSKSSQSRTSVPPDAKEEKTGSGKVVDIMSLLKKSVQKGPTLRPRQKT